MPMMGDGFPSSGDVAALLITLAILLLPVLLSRMASSSSPSPFADVKPVPQSSPSDADAAEQPAPVPTILRTTVILSPEAEGGIGGGIGFRIKRCDVHEDAVVVYFVEPSGPAEAAGISVGCEILAVNSRRVRGCAWASAMLERYVKKYGKVDILASFGPRPRGSLYLVSRIAPDKQFPSSDGFVVDGLHLEDGGGRVRVSRERDLPNWGTFSGLRLTRGDRILSVDGVQTNSIDEFRRAMTAAAATAAENRHGFVPILTSNVFRKFKSAVMATSMLAGASKSWSVVQKPVKIEDLYDVHEKLGEGAFAAVKRATSKETGETWAIKMVNRRSLAKDMEQALRDEIAILKELDHGHVMKLDNVIITISHFYLVTEFLEGGELFDRIVDKSSYTESEARDVCKALFGALSYMAKNNIVHRDLKPENLLLQYKHSDSEIKIADFGFATKAANDHSLSTMCGTPGYVAPEILRKERYGTKVDMWSMGIIVFILMGGYPPFYAENARDLLRQTKRGDFDFDPEYWGEISSGAKDLISSLIVTDPGKRASADEVLSHPWMETDKTALMSCSLAKTQGELKKYIARMRFKKAIHTVLFVKHFSGEQAVFSGKNRKSNAKDLAAECAKLDLNN